MDFELLPNEIILDLFEYIPLIDLFYAFSNLNARFNKLLCVKFEKFHLDLRFLSKTKFNHICANVVPLIFDRILSIHLSDDDNAPQSIELFLSIWSLPKLTDCRCKMWIDHRNDFPNPNIISTSLKRFSIPMASCNLSEIIRLCEYTPNLEYLSINFYDHSGQLQLSSPIGSIIRLKIRFCGSINVLEHLFHSMPNLYHLTLESDDIYIDGYRWEKIIRKYLPKLKIFQFKIRLAPLNKNDKEVQLNEIIETYQTKFWIDEHQWFVRCHWYSLDNHQKFHHIHLFSLPYTFRRFPNDANYILAKSTSPYDNQSLTYDHVTELCYTNSSVSDVCFSTQVE